MIRDKLVFSINDTRLKERMLRDNELTLRRAIEVCRSAELAKTQIQAMQMSPVAQDTSVDVLQKATVADADGQLEQKQHNEHDARYCMS